jgi:hypothetical protein
MKLSTFIENLGGLHDARVTRISFEPGELRLIVEIDDLHVNFAGLPEHPGARSATIILEGVHAVGGSFPNQLKPLWIFEWEIIQETCAPMESMLRWAPAGETRISFSTARIMTGTTLAWPD